MYVINFLVDAVGDFEIKINLLAMTNTFAATAVAKAAANEVPLIASFESLLECSPAVTGNYFYINTSDSQKYHGNATLPIPFHPIQKHCYILDL